MRANTPVKNIVVLISGSGSNMEAIVEQINAGNINGQISAVISNRPNVYGLTRAEKYDIPAVCLDHKTFDSRESYDEALAQTILQYSPDLVVLAGFMRILTPKFVERFAGKMLNIHPSLLPKYPGLNTHQRAIEAGDKYHGSTVHFVTSELDGGPIIQQSVLEISPNDDEDSLTERVKSLEHKLYPEVIALYCQDRLKMSDLGAQIDNKVVELPTL